MLTELRAIVVERRKAAELKVQLAEATTKLKESELIFTVVYMVM